MAVETVEAPGVIVGKLYQGVAKNEFGYKMMAAMGWSEGKVGGCRNSLTTLIDRPNTDLMKRGAPFRDSGPKRTV